jgi:hypothetical protein
MPRLTDARVPQQDSPPLRYSKRRFSQAWAYAGVVIFGIVGLAGAYGTVGLSVQLGNSPGRVALDAVLALVFLWFGGLGAGNCLALTRPWWTLEVRGSVYFDHRTFFSRPRRYDLATATGAWVSVHHSPDTGYNLWLSLQLPDRGACIRVGIGHRKPAARYAEESVRLGLALADALAEHPDPAVVRQAVTDLGWCVRASRRDLSARLNAQRTSRRSGRAADGKRGRRGR